MSGLRIKVGGETVEVPKSVEAKGAEAVAAYVEKHAPAVEETKESIEAQPAARGRKRKAGDKGGEG